MIDDPAMQPEIVRTTLDGVDGSEPLGFLAALGVLTALDERRPGELRLSWPEANGFFPTIHAPFDGATVLALLAEDPLRPKPLWVATRKYLKVEKNGAKKFGGCAPPIGVFRAWVMDALVERPEATTLLAALCSPGPGVPVDPKKLTTNRMHVEQGVPCCLPLDRAAHPTHFDFSSRNLQFLDQAHRIGMEVTAQRVRDELFHGVRTKGAVRRLGWDPYSGRPYALSGGSAPPGCPVHEWFAFRGLEFLPCMPRGRTARTTACAGRRKQGTFQWPLWHVPLTVPAVRSLMALSLAEPWTRKERQARGVGDVFSASLTKSADGYTGIFAPSIPVPPGSLPILERRDGASPPHAG